MEKSANSSRLAHQQKILVRNVVLLLNATLWLFVLYLSTRNDNIAAFLSYLSVIFTILTMKYYLWDVINISECVACFIDFSSKFLLFAGVPLVLLPQYWNTAFYSICLGIIMQHANRKTQVRESNEFLYSLLEDGKTGTTDEIKLLNLQNETHETQQRENKMNDLNKDECCKSVNMNERNDLELKNTTMEQYIKIKRLEVIEDESQNFLTKLSNCYSNASEIASKHKETVISCSKENYLNDREEFKKNENSWHTPNSPKQNISMEAVESTLKRMKYCTQSNVVSNCEGTNEIQNTEKLCSLQVKLSDLQELELSDYSKLESKFELNKNNIERELKRKETESVNISVEHVDLNENLKNISKNDPKQLNTDYSTEFISEPGNKRKRKFHPEDVTFCDVNSDYSENFNQNDFLIYYSREKLLRMHESEGICKIDGKSVRLKLFLKDNKNLHSFSSDCTMSDTVVQHQENTDKVYSEKVYTDSQRENSPANNNRDSNSHSKHESINCTLMKILNIQPEKEMSAYQMKFIPENFDDKSTNLNACFQEQMSEACSIYFETNLNENSFEINKNLNLDIKCSNMNCMSVKTIDVQSEKDIFQRKLVSQQVNEGNPETILEKNDEVLLKSKYSSKSKCLIDPSENFDHNSSELNESADVEKQNERNESVKKATGDVDATHFPNVSSVDVVNRIDMGFIYNLSLMFPM